jgi:hypothetical protein
MYLVYCILWFPLSMPDASASAKTPEILAAKVGTIGREVFSVMLQKCPLPGHLCKGFLPQIYYK